MNKNDKKINALYKAASAYIKEFGGKVLIIGGIQIMEWPDEPENRFSLVIKCCGRKPDYAETGKKKKSVKP